MPPDASRLYHRLLARPDVSPPHYSGRYPAKRALPDADGVLTGVAGTLVELNRVGLSTQPINALDWHTDKLGLCVTAAFDQTVRVCVVTKLNLV